MKEARFVFAPPESRYYDAVHKAFPKYGPFVACFVPVPRGWEGMSTATFWSMIGEVGEWCEEQFGPEQRDDHVNGRWHQAYSDPHFFFRHADDAFAFKMRWC